MKNYHIKNYHIKNDHLKNDRIQNITDSLQSRSFLVGIGSRLRIWAQKLFEFLANRGAVKSQK